MERDSGKAWFVQQEEQSSASNIRIVSLFTPKTMNCNGFGTVVVFSSEIHN